MENRTYKKSLSELNTISKKIELYVNNNATVPPKLYSDFSLTIMEVLDKLATDIGQEELNIIFSDINKYYDTLEEKVTQDIGPLSPIKRTLLIQGYKAIRNKLENYVISNYLDEQLYDNIMDISNFLNKSCFIEYSKTDHYKRKDFDYASYFFNLRNSTLENVIRNYIDAINNLLAAASDDDFYHYLELCASSGASLDAIMLLE